MREMATHRDIWLHMEADGIKWRQMAANGGRWLPMPY
jgi:hypothetical protein